MLDNSGVTIILRRTTGRIIIAIRGILQSILASGIVPPTLVMVIIAGIIPVVMAMADIILAVTAAADTVRVVVIVDQQ